MTAKELLEDYLDQERNNVFCYAANYLMNSPRPGCERAFCAARERVTLLEELLEGYK